MAKTNKAAAREWREETAAKKYVDENFARDRERLRYAGCKRDDMPDPAVFEAAGYVSTAQKIRQALRLLEDAYDEVAHVKIGDDDE